MASAEVLQQMQSRAQQSDDLIAKLRSKLLAVRTAQAEKFAQIEAERLRKENEVLYTECQQLKKDLVRVETQLGLKQVALPVRSSSTPKQSPAVPVSAPVKVAEKKPESKPKEKKKQPKGKGGNQQSSAAELPINVSRLDMRVGHIVSVKKHPDADSLYVEEVDLGEDTNRTVVSGLVHHVPIEQMQDRKAIFMCNLKAAKMRGILSQGMIMCASTPEKVEIIELPAGAEKGDRVQVAGYEGTPDAQLNPKKKIWEQIQPDLKINADGAPTYKGLLWNVQGKGTCSVPSMRECGIK